MKFVLFPADSCAGPFSRGHRLSGSYTIRTPPVFGSDQRQTGYSRVWCDMKGHHGGWLVLQQRINASVNFYRDWISYERGFGQQGFEFRLGNRVLSAITMVRKYVLRIEISYADGRRLFAEYNRFRLLFRNYTLRVGRHRGNLSDILASANNSAFSTWDRDNDKVTDGACAEKNRGAWWYGTTCDTLDLNSMLGNVAAQGVVKTAMKIKPVEPGPGKSVHTHAITRTPFFS